MIKTLLLTDVVDSTKLTEELGDERMADIWIKHDHIARTLLIQHNGVEADRTDGFLMLFDRVDDALAYAINFHESLKELSEAEGIDLKSRIGVHRGNVIILDYTAKANATASKLIDVEGIAKPTAARVMSIAMGGQTLFSQDASKVLRDGAIRYISHGYWRLKGVAEPMQIFEAGNDLTVFQPPPDREKAYRVNELDGIWIPVKDIKHNLSPERDAFLGRSADLAALKGLLDQHSNITTILGMGGVGKTRFAQRFGRSWLGEYPGGVWFCDLSNARSLEGVASATAKALNVPLGKGDPIIQLGNAILGRGRCLIILDNFEQVTQFAEQTIGSWSNRAPKTSFIITSRSLLNLPGEIVFELGPLPSKTDAVDLFVTRAHDRKKSFDPSEINLRDIQEIVALLDGMPLAIELAAARISILQPRQIKERLKDRFKLLSGVKSSVKRQQTLLAAIDWSWDLLEECEKSVLAQCSAFMGGFTIEAAEQIIDVSNIVGAPMIIDVLQSLVDKSLIRSDVQRNDTNELRFGLYLSIYEYSVLKLKLPDAFAGSGPTFEQETWNRHSSYYAQFGTDQAIDSLFMHEGIIKRKSLEIELENLLISSSRCTALNATSVNLLKAIWIITKTIGPLDTIKTPAAVMLEWPTEDPSLIAEVYQVLGACNGAKGHYEKALEDLQKALGFLEPDSNTKTKRSVHGDIGWILIFMGDLDKAREHQEKSLKLSREADDQVQECISLGRMGIICKQKTDYKSAETYYNDAINLAKKLGSVYLEGTNVGNLGQVWAHLDNLKLAKECSAQAILNAKKAGNRSGEGIWTGNIAEIYHELGQFDMAETHLQKALLIAREIGHRKMEGRWLGGLSRIKLHYKEYLESAELLNKALGIFRELGDELTECLYLGYIGISMTGLGKTEEAEQFFNKANKFLKAKDMKAFRVELLLQWSTSFLMLKDKNRAMEKWTEAHHIVRELALNPNSFLRKDLEKTKILIDETETV